MKTRFVLSLLFVLLSFSSLVSAQAYSNYSLEFNQVQDKIVVSEFINQIKQESYVMEGLLEKTSGGYYFVYNLVFAQDYADVEIRLTLEEGFNFDKLLFPQGYKFETDGESISIVWDLQNKQRGDNFPIFLKIKNQKTSNFWLFWLAMALLLIFISYFFLRKFIENKKKSKKIKQKKPFKEKTPEKGQYAYLLDTEKKILEELQKSKSKGLWQKQIQISTGFSKAKLSRIIRNLESRGLIKKIALGNTNKIFLK